MKEDEYHCKKYTETRVLLGQHYRGGRWTEFIDMMLSSFRPFAIILAAELAIYLSMFQTVLSEVYDLLIPHLEQSS